MYTYTSSGGYGNPMTIASVGGTYSLVPARAGEAGGVKQDGFSYCPGETLKMNAQLQQPPNRSGPARVPLPPGLEAPGSPSRSLQPMVIEPLEHEADSRSEPDALHSSGASTADTEPAGEGRVAAPAPGLGDRVNVNPAELPTRGSAGHYIGACKPCAFVYKDGCESGYDCSFCHLCLPGEKIRRKKELKQRRKAQKQP